MTPVNETEANLTTTTTLPTLTTPGAKEFYLFTAEIPDYFAKDTHPGLG
jgi:hypothetical protein